MRSYGRAILPCAVRCALLLAACCAAAPRAGAQGAPAAKPVASLASSPVPKAEGKVERPAASPVIEPKPLAAATVSQKPGSAPSPARDVQRDPSERQLEAETAKLQKLEAELKVLESMPLPDAPAPPTAPKPPQVKPEPKPIEIPKESVKNLEEEYANALYSMGKYDLARAAYERIVQSKPKADILTWARLQMGNCARRAGNLQEAASAYETLMTTSPISPWAAEATWWAGEMKWWILWNQAAK